MGGSWLGLIVNHCKGSLRSENSLFVPSTRESVTAQQPPDSLACEAYAARLSAQLQGKYIIHVSFPQLESHFWSHLGPQLAISKRTGICILDQILILLNFPCNIYSPAGDLFPGKSLLNWLYYQERLRNHTSLSVHWKETAPMGNDENSSGCHKYSKKQRTSLPQSSKKD